DDDVHETTGLVSSTSVRLVEQPAELPLLSLALQPVEAGPGFDSESEEASQVAGSVPSQLSVAVAWTSREAVQEPSCADVWMVEADRQGVVGGVSSTSGRLVEQPAELPLLSLALQPVEAEPGIDSESEEA